MQQSPSLLVAERHKAALWALLVSQEPACDGGDGGGGDDAEI